jgi:2'-5' RNA ligase
VAAHVESVRRIMDPVQSRLIPAHVTLCRNEELAEATNDTLRARLQNAQAGPITLRFGPPERFNGHGMLLGCTAGDHDFRKLREILLGGVSERLERVHITLAHPRNPKAPGNVLANASVLEHGITVTFRMVSLIEQEDQGPWKGLETWELVAARQLRG